MSEWLACVTCTRQYDASAARHTCECGGLLQVDRDWRTVVPARADGGGSSGAANDPDPIAEIPRGDMRALFESRRTSRNPLDLSGVWRFREAVLDADPKIIVTHPEGGTRLYERDGVFFKHEGENPTGSFKDRGMTVAITQAVRTGAKAVACASTGNTSASLAAYAAQSGLRAIVFVPSGKIAAGKLAQTLAYGALCLQVRGDFDAAMRLVREACDRLGIYLVNSINPYRIEGQKTIVWELLQDLQWKAPDWIIVPAGNLGNTSAFGKALREAYQAGWIDRVPRLAAIQAEGANPFFLSFREGFANRHRVDAETVASAIRIGDPVSFTRAVDAIRFTSGVVEQVSDPELLAAKREIDRMGIGCEPASATTLAGLRKLQKSAVIGAQEQVVCVLTGHVLKDAGTIMQNTPADQIVEIEPSMDAVERAISHR